MMPSDNCSPPPLCHRLLQEAVILSHRLQQQLLEPRLLVREFGAAVAEELANESATMGDQRVNMQWGM